MSQSFRVVRQRRPNDHRVQMPISNESLYARPSSADGGKRNKTPKRHHSASSKPTGFRNKLAKKFLRSKDDDFKLKTPPGFIDYYEPSHRSLSPESPFQRNRYYSLGSRTALKIKRIGKDKEEAFFMWKPCKRKCEWESMSGRQLTIADTTATELSKMELDHVQRLAIARLQGMDISVSYSLLKAGRSGKLGKFSNSMRRKISTERPVSTAVFGQPLTAVIDFEKTRGTITSPTSTVPVGGGFGGNSTCPSSTYQNHPDQPIASERDEECLADTTFDMIPQDAKLSPLSPHRDPFPSTNPEHLVPLIVQKAIKHLDNYGIKTEGIFRVPGAKARIDEIRKQFDKGEDVDIPEDSNPHDVACLFKEFFRSLPEPLMTRDLYYPLLQTRQLQHRSQQKEALQLLCMLLPRPNRDTLHELVQFLSRVALHSNDTILLDGTEEAGNRMTSQNLATVFGPNIIHNESKRKNVQVTYQVTRADPEELTGVCNVMEDLILWHGDIFKIPAELYDTALRNLFLTDHETVDTILKQQCGHSCPNDDSCTSAAASLPVSDVLRSRSSDCLRHLQTTGSSYLRGSSESDEHIWHQRSHSLSDTERSLDVLMKNIEDMLCEDLPSNHRRLSSNDSAMGESECITSPCQHHARSDSSHRDPSMYNSVDSAISNHSSHHFSSLEGVAYPTVDPTHIDSIQSRPHPCPTHHIRMCSEMSIQLESPVPFQSSPGRVNSPKFMPKIQPFYRGSLPVLNPNGASSNGLRSMSPLSFIRKLRKSSSTNTGKGPWNRKNKLYRSIGSIEDKMPEYHLQRSPILGRRCNFEPADPPASHMPVAMETVAEDIMKAVTDETLENLTPRFHFVIQPVSEVLI